MIGLLAALALGVSPAYAEEAAGKPPEAMAPGADARVPEPPDYRMSDFRSPCPGDAARRQGA